MPEGAQETAAAVRRERIAVLFAVLDTADRANATLSQPGWDAVHARLAEDVAAERRRLTNLDQGDPLDADADDRLTAAAVLTIDLAEECLELANGARARETGFDAVVCRVADRLVAELVSRLPLPQWVSLCVPGAVDQYSRRSRVIHVGISARVDPWGLWALPSVAHELGHRVAPLITAEAGDAVLHHVQALLSRARQQDPAAGRHLGELFADCFAAWVLGPAYGLSVARLGFGLGSADPGHGDGGSHPPVSVRLRQVAITTRQLGGVAAAVDEVERLAGLCLDHTGADGHSTTDQTTSEQAGADDVRDAGDAAPAEDGLDPWCDELRDVLASRLGTAAYARWSTAQGLASWLLSTAVAPAGAQPPPVCDVLNAGWWARTNAPHELRRITERVRLLV